MGILYHKKKEQSTPKNIFFIFFAHLHNTCINIYMKNSYIINGKSINEWSELMNIPCYLLRRQINKNSKSFIEGTNKFLSLNEKQIEEIKFNKLSPQNKITFVYIMELYSSTEKFYKIGITSSPYNRKKTISYHYSCNIIKLSKKETKKEAKLSEDTIKSIIAPHSYLPIKNFAGKTECFHGNNQLLDSIIKIM
jgi:hypothetical protein